MKWFNKQNQEVLYHSIEVKKIDLQGKQTANLEICFYSNFSWQHIKEPNRNKIGFAEEPDIWKHSSRMKWY